MYKNVFVYIRLPPAKMGPLLLNNIPSGAEYYSYPKSTGVGRV